MKITIMGNLNAETQEQRDGEIVGKYALEVCHKCREKWFWFCANNEIFGFKSTQDFKMFLFVLQFSQKANI